MNKKDPKVNVTSQTEAWVPQERISWPSASHASTPLNDQIDDYYNDIQSYVKEQEWKFPKETIHFIADIHADADAMLKSLIGSALIEKKGEKDTDFKLTSKGQEGVVVIGGDCLDKGPSNLRLLKLIKSLMDAGMNIELIAGNHDIRTYVGLAIGEERQLLMEHMFVRMGKKTIPLFKEIYREYLHGKIDLNELPDADEVERRLFPSEEWYTYFPEKMKGIIPDKKIEREIVRIREKIEDIRHYLKRAKFTHGMLYATVEKAQELFLKPEGDYYWFFNQMQLALQKGSFLFVHAGMDDESTDYMVQAGIEGLNRKFKNQKADDPFELYHGHLGNIFRTKYRDTDFPFSRESASKLHDIGVHAIVHGHRNILQGHRLTIKKGVLNFECDTSLDRKTRKLEGLSGYGASWLTMYPNGLIEGYSTDYPSIREFRPGQMGGNIGSAS